MWMLRCTCIGVTSTLEQKNHRGVTVFGCDPDLEDHNDTPTKTRIAPSSSIPERQTWIAPERTPKEITRTSRGHWVQPCQKEIVGQTSSDQLQLLGVRLFYFINCLSPICITKLHLSRLVIAIWLLLCFVVKSYPLHVSQPTNQPTSQTTEQPSNRPSNRATSQATAAKAQDIRRDAWRIQLGGPEVTALCPGWISMLEHLHLQISIHI